MGSNGSKNSAHGSPRASPAKQKDIRDADRLIIDASYLSCPTCLETYVKSPFVLQCGHSFCRTCTSHFVRRFGGDESVECPLCCRKFSVLNDQLAAFNYAMDNILDGVRACAREETQNEDAIELIPNLRFDNKRLRTELQEKDQTIAEMRQNVQTAERKVGALKLALGIVMVVLLLRWVPVQEWIYTWII